MLTRAIIIDWRDMIYFILELFQKNVGFLIYFYLILEHQTTGFVAPLVTSALTGHDVHDPKGWRNLFLIASAAIAGPYLVFVSMARLDKLLTVSEPTDKGKRSPGNMEMASL